MGITHVIRGEDHVNGTPKYLMILRALGLPEPTAFAHMPLLVNEGRKKLSKRRDDVSVADYRAEGFLREGIVNYLSLLGWGPPDGVEVRPIEEIVELYDLAQVNPSPAFFDRKKLLHVNAEWIRRLSLDDFLGRAGELPAARRGPGRPGARSAPWSRSGCGPSPRWPTWSTSCGSTSRPSTRPTGTRSWSGARQRPRCSTPPCARLRAAGRGRAGRRRPSPRPWSRRPSRPASPRRTARRRWPRPRARCGWRSPAAGWARPLWESLEALGCRPHPRPPRRGPVAAGLMAPPTSTAEPAAGHDHQRRARGPPGRGGRARRAPAAVAAPPRARSSALLLVLVDGLPGRHVHPGLAGVEPGRRPARRRHRRAGCGPVRRPALAGAGGPSPAGARALPRGPGARDRGHRRAPGGRHLHRGDDRATTGWSTAGCPTRPS